MHFTSEVEIKGLFYSITSISSEKANARSACILLTIFDDHRTQTEEEQANFRGRTYLGPIGAASIENDDLSDDIGTRIINPNRRLPSIFHMPGVLFFLAFLFPRLIEWNTSQNDCTRLAMLMHESHLFCEPISPTTCLRA